MADAPQQNKNISDLNPASSLDPSDLLEVQQGVGIDSNKKSTLTLLANSIRGLIASAFATAAQGAKADTALQAVVPGANITVDTTNPTRPVINGSPSGVQSIVAGDNISVDATDPAHPKVSGAAGGGGGGGLVYGITPALDKTHYLINKTLAWQPTHTIVEADVTVLTGLNITYAAKRIGNKIRLQGNIATQGASGSLSARVVVLKDGVAIWGTNVAINNGTYTPISIDYTFTATDRNQSVYKLGIAVSSNSIYVNYAADGTTFFNDTVGSTLQLTEFDSTGSGGGSPSTGTWEVLSTYDFSVDGAKTGIEVDVTNYGDVWVEFEGVTQAVAGYRGFQVSTDGGATWKTALEYDYTSNNNGAIGTDTIPGVGLHGSQSTSAVTAAGRITLPGVGRTPVAILNRQDLNYYLRDYGAPINRIRYGGIPNGVGALINLTGGKARVLGIKKLVSSGGISSGAAFPTSPSLNQLYLRTDLNLLCFWNGTYWLTQQEYTLPFTQGSALPWASGGIGAFAPIRTDYQMFVTKWDCPTYVAVTNNATNYMTVNLQLRQAGDAATTWFSFTTAADTPSDTKQRTTSINTAVPTGTKLLQFTPIKTGNPGNLFIFPAVYYRLIVT